MTPRRELIQDLRAHAHEANAQCAALMRSAANELERHESLVIIEGRRAPEINERLAPAEGDVKGAPCS